jgi:hypothetical protein
MLENFYGGFKWIWTVYFFYPTIQIHLWYFKILNIIIYYLDVSLSIMRDMIVIFFDP